MVDGARDGFVLAAGGAADEQRRVGVRRLPDVLPEPDRRRTVAEQHAVGAIPRLPQQLLRDAQLVLQLLVAPLQLLLQLADREVRPDAGEHLVRLEGLVDEIHRAELEAPHLLARLRQRREEDDRAVARVRVSLEPGARLEAVHARHHDVEQHQVRHRAGRNREGVAAAAGGEQPVAPPLERLIEDLQIRGVVVDQQDLGAARVIWVHLSLTCSARPDAQG